MNLLKKLVGAASNVEHAVGGAATAVFGNKGNNPQPQPFNVAPMQKVNLKQGGPPAAKGAPVFGQPAIPTYQGNQIRLDAQKKLGFSPDFVTNLINAQPYVGRSLATRGLVSGNSQGTAAEYLGQHQLIRSSNGNYNITKTPTGTLTLTKAAHGKYANVSVPNQIVLPPAAFGSDPATILHEGLHRVYDSNPQVQGQFNNAYNKSATPAVKGYVGYRLTPYTGATNGLDEGGVPIPNYNPNDINTMQPHLQNETHSYTSELPTLGKQLPPALDNYYKKYFNTSKARSSALKKLRTSGADIRAGA